MNVSICASTLSKLPDRFDGRTLSQYHHCASLFDFESSFTRPYPFAALRMGTTSSTSRFFDLHVPLEVYNLVSRSVVIQALEGGDHLFERIIANTSLFDYQAVLLN